MRSYSKPAAVVGAVGFLAISTAAHAELPLTGIIGQGKAVIDLRVRYETVQDASKTIDANAVTARARLGYDTGYWNNFQLGFDFDQIWTLGGATYNSTRNGKTTYPTISDPAMTTLNRLTLTYASDFDTKFVLGRQRLLIGNQRFVGNAGWRQHEQTFDSISAVNTSIPDLTLSYAWVYRVNRIGGPALPSPSTTAPAATGQASYFKSNSHIFDGVYVGIDNLKLEGYGFLLDLGAPAYATLAPQKTAASKLSSATIGGRADYVYALTDDITTKFTGEFAHQSQYAKNPTTFSLNYFLGEASASWNGLTGLAGYEVLQGDGAIGFATPLATLHAFNGWADMFLTTPVNGLKDLYFKGVYSLPADFLDSRTLNATVVYHDYKTDMLNKGIGSEWDAQLELVVDAQASFLVKYANYAGSGAAFGGFADKSIFWAQAAYKY